MSKQYEVADKFTGGSVVCPNLFSAVVEYVAQRPLLTTIVIYVIPVAVLSTLVSLSK